MYKDSKGYYIINNIELIYDASKVLLAVLLGAVILRAPSLLLALEVAPVLTGQTPVLLVAVPVLTRQILAMPPSREHRGRGLRSDRGPWPSAGWRPHHPPLTEVSWQVAQPRWSRVTGRLGLRG